MNIKWTVRTKVDPQEHLLYRLFIIVHIRPIWYESTCPSPAPKSYIQKTPFQPQIPYLNSNWTKNISNLQSERLKIEFFEKSWILKSFNSRWSDPIENGRSSCNDMLRNKNFKKEWCSNVFLNLFKSWSRGYSNLFVLKLLKTRLRHTHIITKKNDSPVRCSLVVWIYVD